MMNLKLGKGNSRKGSLELGNLTFDDNRIEVAIDIVDMSEDLKTEFDKMIEIKKVNYICEMEKWYSDHPEYTKKRDLKWCNEPVIIMYSFLQVILEVEKPIKYKIIVAFMDANDEFMDSDVEMDIDLSEYEENLKGVIVKALTNRFF